MSDDSKQDEFLALARKRFAAASEDEKELRAKFEDDLRFASPDGDDQWDEQVKQQRNAAGRPTLAFPRGHVFVRQVANEGRQQKPQIKYAPSLDEYKDTAEIIEGLARNIQYDSQAQVAYDTALEYAAGGSFGYYRILTDYCDDESDDQEIKIVPVLDPLTVYGVLVPAIFGRKPKWWFVIEDIPKEEYKAQYGDKFEDTSLSWDEAEKKADGWIGSDTVRVAEYWYVKEEKVEGKRRPKTTIKFCKINGLEILPDSETEWAGTICNVIPVLGGQMIYRGKPKLFSVVRPQKSAQQMLNYAKSRIAETLAQSPVSPFIVVDGQISGFEKEWASLNTVPKPYLTVKGIDVAGRPVEKPQRQVYEPPIAALSAFVAQEVDDMKATSGIFDASLGARGNETSGQAISQRQAQADTNNMHYMDNLERSFKQAGDVIAELIPKIYDVEREITILGANEAQKIVTINKAHVDASGQQKNYDVAGFKGKYVVTMGKAYSSKRAESFDTMAQIIHTAPNMFPIVGDIMLRNSDMAGADEAADRLHAMLPPALQKNEQEQIPPQAQAIVAQAQQQMGMMQGELQKLQFEKQAKVVEHQAKMQQIQAQAQADMALEDKKLLAAITVAEINTKAQNAADREADRRALEMQFHDQAHEVGMAAVEHSHDQELAAQQAQHAQDAQAQAAAQQQAQADGQGSE